MEDKIYFCNILNEQMQQNNMKFPALTEELNRRGFKCNRRQIQRYRNGEYVPSYEMASAMIRILHITIPGAELERILSDSRIYTTEVRRYKKIKSQKTISLNFNDIHVGSDIGAEDLSEIIDERLDEVFGAHNCLNLYVAKLIELDLKEKILKESD